MIRYGNFLDFSCAPRTGTAWVLKAFQLAGLGRGFRTAAHIPFPLRRDRTTFRVALVRHPCDWLASCYAAVGRGGVDDNHLGAFERLGGTSFDDFVRAYLYNIPGGVDRLFSLYTRPADSCLRIEDMPWALLELLEAAGVSKEGRNRCIAIPRQNVSRRVPAWNVGLRADVMRAERELVEMFEYR